MAKNATVFNTISNNILLGSVVFKFIAMMTGVLGNGAVIIHTIFSNKEKTATSYLVGNLALADLLVCSTFYPTWIIEFIQIILNIDSDQDFYCKFSRSTMWAFMFASIATLLAITVDRYLYIVKPLKYPQIMTLRRVLLAVLGIWITACFLFILHYIHDRSYAIKLRSVCSIPSDIYYLTTTCAGYLPLILIFFLNFNILCVARKQRKRILPANNDPSVNNSTEESTYRMSFVLGFFVALKAAKTFAIVVAVLTFCMLTPTVVGEILSDFCIGPCYQIWVVVFHYELYGINSVVNAFIYGIRHGKYRKAFRNSFSKLFSCHEATN